jgi:tryptophanyl-tRNA synthetase
MVTLLSAIQPTGNIHIGNYLGSITKWIELQKKYNSIFSIVDLHALTNHSNQENIYANSLKTLAIYIASGINPDHALIFRQSDVPAHCELFWIINCITQIGKLNRMTQFKEKTGKNKEQANLGLYNYPILMAADIMLYKATKIPVGEDQRQHIELTNEIIQSFNYKYKTEYFTKIDIIIDENNKRIMSLRDGSKKMSKSDISEYSRINIFDSDDQIKAKIMKAKTDLDIDLTINIESRPEINNLLKIFSAFSNKSFSKIQDEYNNYGHKKLKTDLADIIISKLSPIRKKALSLLDDKIYLEKILENNAAKANDIADKNIKEIKKIIGIN